MSLFSAILWDGTTLANIRYRFYGSDGVASAAEQNSGIAQNASGRPVFAIDCVVPAGAFTLEIYDNSQAANWTAIPLNFARGDNLGALSLFAGTVQTFDALLTALSTAHGAGSWATATGFSTLTAADVRAAVGMASANLDTQIVLLAASLVKIQAATYDSATVVGDTLTLSNGATQAKVAGNRVTT